MQAHRPLVAVTVLGVALAAYACTPQTTAEEPPAPPAAPAADFMASQTAGNAPLMVDFTDLSSDATSWLWDFGDGQVSAEQSPQHVYEAPGLYSVKLTATGAGGTDVETKAGLIQAVATIADTGLETQTAGMAPAAPWTVFAGTPTGTAEHVVRSTTAGDAADNGMPTQGTHWLEVSAASTDDVPPPSTVPFTEGVGGSGPAGVTQVIRLSATHTVLQFDACFVNAEGGPDSMFNDWMSVDITDGVDAHNLFFRNTFSGTEGSSTIHGNPVTPIEHVAVDLAQLFPSATTLTDLTLTVQTANVGDSSVDSLGYIDNLRLVQPLPMPLDAEFIVSQRVGGVGTPFRFTDMTTGAAPKAWIWEFGDGSASTEEEPDKVYSSQGTFDVKLTAMTPGSSDAETKAAFVLVDDSACETAAFQIVTAGGNCQGTGTTVEFQNDSVNADSFVWDFGDGSMPLETASAGNVMHTYNTPGDYDVELTVIGPCFSAAQTPPAQVTDMDTLDIVDPPSGANVSFSMTSPFGTGVTCSPPGFVNNKAAYRQETVRFTASNSNPNTGPLTYSWNFGDGSNGNGTQVDHAFNVAATRTVTLTASNCAGSVMVQQTIKVVQDWETVYGYINAGGCNTGGCHDSGNIMNLNGQTTAFNAIRNVNTINSCAGIPSKRVSIACSGSTSNSNLSAIIWALSNDVCGNGVMSSNCGCLNPVTNAAQVNDLRAWIDFGSPNN